MSLTRSLGFSRSRSAVSLLRSACGVTIVYTLKYDVGRCRKHSFFPFTGKRHTHKVRRQGRLDLVGLNFLVLFSTCAVKHRTCDSVDSYDSHGSSMSVFKRSTRRVHSQAYCFLHSSDSVMRGAMGVFSRSVGDVNAVSVCHRKDICMKPPCNQVLHTALVARPSRLFVNVRNLLF